MNIENIISLKNVQSVSCYVFVEDVQQLRMDRVVLHMQVTHNVGK